jgi:hypothetical protein
MDQGTTLGGLIKFGFANQPIFSSPDGLPSRESDEASAALQVDIWNLRISKQQDEPGSEQGLQCKSSRTSQAHISPLKLSEPHPPGDAPSKGCAKLDRRVFVNACEVMRAPSWGKESMLWRSSRSG